MPPSAAIAARRGGAPLEPETQVSKSGQVGECSAKRHMYNKYVLRLRARERAADHHVKNGTLYATRCRPCTCTGGAVYVTKGGNVTTRDDGSVRPLPPLSSRCPAQRAFKLPQRTSHGNPYRRQFVIRRLYEYSACARRALASQGIRVAVRGTRPALRAAHCAPASTPSASPRQHQLPPSP